MNSTSKRAPVGHKVGWITGATAFALILVLGYLLGMALFAGSDDKLTQQRIPSRFQGGLGGDDPLGGAELVSAEIAESAIASSCSGCPLLADTGAASASDVSQAWVRSSDGAVVFEFKSGLKVYFYRDDRSEAEYLKDVQQHAEVEGSDWPFWVTSVRGTRAEVTDIHDAKGHVGPAAVSWVEGGYLVTLIGDGGQTLSDLIGIAETLK